MAVALTTNGGIEVILLDKGVFKGETSGAVSSITAARASLSSLSE
jgi:hypothetical protein